MKNLLLMTILLIIVSFTSVCKADDIRLKKVDCFQHSSKMHLCFLIQLINETDISYEKCQTSFYLVKDNVVVSISNWTSWDISPKGSTIGKVCFRTRLKCDQYDRISWIMDPFEKNKTPEKETHHGNK